MMKTTVKKMIAVSVMAACGLMPVAALSAEGFALTSPAFADNDILSSKHAGKGGPRNCDGENISPPLEWSNAPEATQSFAMVVHDAVGGHGLGITHWVAYGISPQASSLAEGVASSPAVDNTYIGGTNVIKQPTYLGPCPDVGDVPHHYEFVLIATDLAPDALAPGLTRDALFEALAGHTLGATSLVGRYARN